MTQDDHGDDHDLHMVDEDARGLRGTTISLQYGATALVILSAGHVRKECPLFNNITLTLVKLVRWLLLYSYLYICKATESLHNGPSQLQVSSTHRPWM